MGDRWNNEIMYSIYYSVETSTTSYGYYCPLLCNSCLFTVCKHIYCTCKRSTLHVGFTVGTVGFQTVLFPLLHHPLGIASLPSHIRTSSTYTLFLTRLKTHLFAESLLWHCDVVAFSLYFWRPRALDVGRHSKFMLIDWSVSAHWAFLSISQLLWLLFVLWILICANK